MELLQPIKAIADKEEVTLEIGQHIGLPISANLKPVLDYVTHKGQVWAHCLGKVPLKGGRKLWEYDLRCNGRKAPFQAVDVGPEIEADDGDVPIS